MLIPVTVVSSPSGIPAGAMFEWPTDTPPVGYLMCDGTVYNVSAYPTLGALLVALTTYGGNGTTTFGVPDRRGRVGVGKGTNTDVDTIGENDGLPVGSRSPAHNTTSASLTVTGAPTAGTLAASSHSHGSTALSVTGAPGITDPGHTHVANNLDGGSSHGWQVGSGNSLVSGSSTTGISATLGTLDVGGSTDSTAPTISGAPAVGTLDVGGSGGPGGSRPDDRPAFIVVNYIIKT